jgi:type II secretory pathway pseudopilin PulG
MDREVPRHEHDDSGFTLVEVIIAGVVLVVGLVAVAYGVTLGLAVVSTAQMDTLARQKAREAMEDVFTARDTASITFDQICNEPNTGCLFKSGFYPLTLAGADGIVNTDDDVNDPRGANPPATPQCGTVAIANPNHMEWICTPGPDGILGTSDDVTVLLVGYQRSIQVTQITSLLKQITVTIQYTTPGNLTRKVTLVAVMSPYV